MSLNIKRAPQALVCLLLCGAFLISACSAMNLPSSATATAAATNAPDEPGDQVTAQATSEPTNEAVTLTLWVPVEFDPAGGSLAASMLESRLREFGEQHPQVRLQVRVKAEEGPGGLLDSLLTAQSAAPLALPDLILMPHQLLGAAADNEILHPIESFSEAWESEDWYPFAREMAEWQGSPYGISFAADALVLAYRPTALEQVPASWQDLLASRNTLGFAAGDTKALFSFAELLALEENAEPEDQSGLFTEASLSALFAFYAQGQEDNVFPFWLTQYQNTEQSWQAFSEGRVPMVAAWTSRLFTNRLSDQSAAPLPTQDGQPFALIKGWVWAVSSPGSERIPLAVELAEFLSSPEFIAQWSAAAGLLPPRPSSLAAWSPDAKQALASQIVINASPLPDQETMSLWGEAISRAVVSILKAEMDPEEAVQLVLDAVSE
jgi:multiple sugar transport system substrate-binding protein